MGVGRRPVQGPSPAPGNALSTGLADAQAANSSLSSMPAAESFRCSWQSVLASLGAGLDGMREEGTGAKRNSTSVEATLGEPGQTLSPAASTHGGGTAQSLQQGRTQQGGPAESPTILSQSGARAGIQDRQTAHGARSGEPGKKAGQGAASELNAADLVSAMAWSVPFAMPASGAASPAAIKIQPQSSGTELSAELPTGLPRSLGPGAAGGTANAGRKSPAGNHAADAAGTAPDATMMPAGRSSTLDEGQNGAEPGSSGQEALPLRPSRVQIEAPSEMHEQCQNQTQPGTNILESVLPPIVSLKGDGGLLVAQDAALQSTTVNPIAAKSGMSGGGRTARQDAHRLTHAAGSGESSGTGSNLTGGQMSGAEPTVSTMAHDPAGAYGPTIGASGLTGSSGHSAPGPDAAETFAALDAGSVPGKPAWIHAGAQRAEAGFQDPALGWVGVRADMSGGGVHAALVPGSADAAVTLGGHLAGLNSYLAEQHTPVETLTLAAPESRGAGQDMNQGMSQGFNQGDSPHAGQGTAGESQANHGLRVSSPSVAASQEASAEVGRADGMGFGKGSGGAHISVMA